MIEERTKKIINGLTFESLVNLYFDFVRDVADYDKDGSTIISCSDGVADSVTPFFNDNEKF